MDTSGVIVVAMVDAAASAPELTILLISPMSHVIGADSSISSMTYLLYPLRSKQSWSVVAVDMVLVGQHSCKNPIFATASDALIPLGSFLYFAVSVAAKSNIALAASISCRYSEVEGTFSLVQAPISNSAQMIDKRNVCTFRMGTPLVRHQIENIVALFGVFV
uniref:Uncharacterized protein n=1 Tax=Xylella fastidiosa TaxID=2371 RepID=Q9AMP5_XYLFS|nr:unknown [Xylella fastidiosa]